MEVLPSTARFTDTRLSHGGQEWMRDGVLQVEFSIARHLRAEAPGIEKLRLTDAHLKLDGVTAAMDVSTDMQGKVTVKGIPGKGSVYADLGLARGVLELLEDINAQGTTIVMVTHDPELAARAQRNVHIVDGMATDLSLEPGLARAPASSADAATSHLA